MKAHHIALVLHDFSTGGSERIAIRLANQWLASGRLVTVLCGTEQGALRELVAPGIRVEACKPETVRSPWSRLQLGWRLGRLVRKHCPDIVFAPGNFHLVVLAILSRMRFATRPAFLCKLSNPIGRADKASVLDALVDVASRLAITRVDALIAMSPSLRIQAQAVFGCKTITEISEPVLQDHAKTHPRQLRKDRAPVIVCAGRLCRQKDFATAIKAFGRIAEQANAKLLILGEGPLRGSLERLATHLGVSHRITMPGHVPDIGPYLAQADLFLMTSRYEGYPAVLIETIAAGVPVVTTNCSPAMFEIMQSPDLGRVVNSHEPKDIAIAIGEQLAQPMPDVTLSREFVERHRIGPSSAAYLSLFDRIAA